MGRFMVNDRQRQPIRRLIQHGARMVAGAVIDDHHFGGLALARKRSKDQSKAVALISGANNYADVHKPLP